MRAKQSFAIKNDGTLWGWGYNAARQLGDGTTTNVNTPKKIGTENNWKSVSTGDSNTLAIKNDGTLWGWGNNQGGELGDGTTSAKTIPTLVDSGYWSQISTGNYMSAGIKSDGTLWIWGRLITSGGDWYVANRPVSVANSHPNLANLKWANVAVGDRYILAVTQDGKLYGYGWNVNYQVQMGLSQMVHFFQLLSQDNDWAYVCPTFDFSMALKKDGTLWAWGYGQNANIGGYGERYPTLITPAAKWTKVVATSKATVLGLKPDGTIWSFGNNSDGALGRTATAENQFIPTQIGDSRYTQIAAGEGHFYALKTDGTIWAWGLNDYGQVGDGTQTNATTPRQVLTAAKDLGEQQKYSWNTAPTVTITAPTTNQTLYENSSLTLAGNTIDTDIDNVVTVKYQINSGTVRNLHSAVSDGITTIDFLKALTYKDGMLYDGATAVTGVLDKDMPHTVSIWAEDDKGGKSSVITRSFFVVPNRPPTLTINPIAAQSELINSNVINVDGAVSDLDGNDVTVTFSINGGEEQQVYQGPPAAFAFNLLLNDLRVGANTVLVKATDTYNFQTTKTLTITKTHDAVPVNEAVALYKITAPTGSAKSILLWITRTLGAMNITAEISLTNNGEAENFVPLTKTNSALVNGLRQDEFAYQGEVEKTNIVLKITYDRTDAASVEVIKQISGVLF